MKFSLKKIFAPENFAIFLLVLFCIRYIPLETRSGPSMVKTAVSGICAIYLFTKASGFSKAVFYGAIYFTIILFSALLHPLTFRWSTILYLLSFILTFMCFYNLIWVKQVLTLHTFLRVLKYFIYAYVIVLLIQQACILVGLRYFPLVNLCQVLDRGLGANSLSGEPSTAARVMSVLMYAYIKCREYQQGDIVSLKQMFNTENKFVTFSYLYAVMTMGSGTAFLCIALLSLYFLRLRYSFIVIPLYIAAFVFISHSENESFRRMSAAVEVTMTGDTQAVKKTDTSAAARINPMLNTIQNLDLSKTETWLGHGIDWNNSDDAHYSGKQMVGDIGDYGLIAYFASLLFVFSCAIYPFSIPTIMFFLGVGGATNNFAYSWGILMVFTAVRYFRDNYYNEEDEVDYEEEDEEDLEYDEYLTEEKEIV